MSRRPGRARVAGSHRPGRARAAAHRGAGAQARAGGHPGREPARQHHGEEPERLRQAGDGLGQAGGGAARDRRYGKGNGGDKRASQTPAATRHRRHLNHPGAARSVRVPGYLAPDLALRNGLMRVNAQADRRRQERPRHGRVDDPGVPHIMDARAPGESVGRPAARVVVFRDRPDSHDDQHAERKYRGVNPVTAPPLDLLDRLLAGVLLSVRGHGRAGIRSPLINNVRHVDSLGGREAVNSLLGAHSSPTISMDSPGDGRAGQKVTGRPGR